MIVLSNNQNYRLLWSEIRLLKIIIPLAFILGLIIPAYATNADVPQNVKPIRIWDEYQIIFDGVITDIVNHKDSKEYHIHVSYYYKSMQKFDSIIAYGVIEMEKGDRGLFFIYDNGQNYQISEYSMPITKHCLQTERMRLVTIPNISLDSIDTFPGIVNLNSCLPEHFGLINNDIILPSQSSIFVTNQLQENKSLKKINCREQLELIFKYDKTQACVKSSSVSKLVQRGWALA